MFKFRHVIPMSLAFIAAILLFSWRPAAAQSPPSNTNSPLGTNLAGIASWSTQRPFVDYFKTARPWITQCQTGDPGCTGQWSTDETNLLDLDEHGWLQSLPAAADPPIFTRVGTLMDGNLPNGEYIVLYDGEGTLEYGLGSSKNDGVSTLGRDVVDVTGNQIYLVISATDPNSTGEYIRNIRVVSSADEATYEAQVFNPAFLARIERFGVLRFMDWMETNNSEQGPWSNRPQPSDATYMSGAGVPLEVMLDLANRLNADPWFTMPHMATDEYFTEFAKIVRDDLAPNSKVYIEYSNEVWNSQFAQADWVSQQAEAQWPGGSDSEYTKRLNWYGKRVAEMCDIWKGAWGTDSDHVVCVMASQAANDWTGNQELTCPLWTEGAPCVDHGIDTLAVAPYFGGYLGAPEHESLVEGWTADVDGGLDKLFNELAAGNLLPDGENVALEQTYEWMTKNFNVAEGYGLDLITYEGGQHLAGRTGVENNDAITDLFIAANRDPRMGILYAEYLAKWRQNGGLLFVNFSDIGQPSKWGSWGVLEDVDQTSSPKYDALMNFITANPCWWNGCNNGTTMLPPDQKTLYLPLLVKNATSAAPAVAGQYVITWKTTTARAVDPNSRQAQVPPMNIELLDVSNLIQSGAGDLAEELLNSYKDNPDVASVEPNYIYTISDVPNDPGQANQWAWDVVDAYEAWDVAQGRAGVVIAIIDTGIQLNHPDLSDKLVPGYDFASNDETPDDGHGHGTHVAGSAAAATNNSTGAAGTCPNCSLMPLRALNNNGSGTVANIAQAVIYAADNGAQVINMSLGGSTRSTTLENAINYAWDRGVFLTCAAGNSNSQSQEYPAGYDNCFAVAATTSSDVRASFSNYGSWVDVAAPGSSIYSTWINSQYGNLSGTSMATPHVAGLAGLLASQGLSNAQIRDRICDTSDQISGTGNLWSCGRINVNQAVRAGGENPPPTATFTPTSIPTNTPTSTPTNTPQPEPTNTPEPNATATPIPTATATSPPSETGAIINGGFEEGLTGWAFATDEILSSARPFSGEHSARLGGENNSSDVIDQTFTVPGDGRLTYYWSAEGTTDFADRLRLDITLVDSGARYTLWVNGSSGYWFRRRIRFSGLAGYDINVKFSAATNGSNPTAFYVDEVSY